MSLWWRAMLELSVVSTAGAAIGVHVVLRRLPFLTVALAHGSFPGLMIASWVGFTPILGALGMAWLLVTFLVMGRRLKSLDQSVSIGVLLAGSLGVGAVLQGLQPRPKISLASLLAGNIVGTTNADVLVSSLVALAVAVLLIAANKELLLGAFDSNAAAAMGYGFGLELVLLLVVAAVVVSTLPAMGAVLSIAVITVPAMTARLWTDSIGATFAIAIGVGLGTGLGGLWLSRAIDAAAGGTIAVTGACVYLVSWLARWFRLRQHQAFTAALQ
jgi:manganese/iron transport system permease protein